MAVSDVFITLENQLHWGPVNNAKLIWSQWIKMLFRKYPGDVHKARKRAGPGDKWLAMDIRKCLGKNETSNLPELVHTTVVCKMCWVQHDDHTYPENLEPCVQIWAAGRSWLISSRMLEAWKNHTVLTKIFLFTLDQEELDEEYIG